MSQRLTSLILKETNSQRKLMTKMMMTGVTVAPAMKVKVREKQLTGTGTIKRQIPLLIPKREINKYYK